MAESRGMSKYQKIGFGICALIVSAMVALAHPMQGKLMANLMALDPKGPDRVTPLGYAFVDMSMPVIYVTAGIILLCHHWLAKNRFLQKQLWLQAPPHDSGEIKGIFRGRGFVIFLLVISAIIFCIIQYLLVGLYLDAHSMELTEQAHRSAPVLFKSIQ
ncbi:MAG: hypothetical protein FJX23_03210 [Alphaproteobacteria bacterium]|nr:hypothetical protein [Alphaproteobacteria bacterium]